MKKLILAPFVALAAIIATAIPASAVQASPSDWEPHGTVAIITDGGAQAVRVPLGPGNYAATAKFASYLLPGGGGAGGMLSLCATYRANSTSGSVSPTFWREDNAWRTQLPAATTSYVTKCAWIYNTWGGGGWVGLASTGSGSANLLVKNVTIN